MKRYLINNRSTIVITGLLILIVGLGSFLRFYQIGKLSFWLDETSTYVFSSGSLNDLITSIKDNPNMSLYFVLAFLWIRIFPDASDGALRALSALISVACIPVVFLLGRTMTNDRKKAAAIGLISAFLITVNTSNLQYAQEFRSYSLTFLLTTMSTFFLIKDIEDTESKHQWLIWYTILTAAAVYSHFYAVFIIAAQAVTLPILLFDKNKHYFKFRRLLYSGICMASLILPIALLAYSEGYETISWISKPTLGSLKSFAKQITGNQGEGLFAFYFLFGCIGLFFRERFGFQRDLITKWKFAITASCLFLPIVAALAISFLMKPIFQSRYLLYVMPYLAVLAAAGIVTLVTFRSKSKKHSFFFAPIGIGALVLFVLLSNLSIQDYYNNYQKTDWRKATQFLTSRCSESLRLYYAPYVDMCVLRYNPALNSQEAEWWVNILKNNPNSDELAASLPTEYNQVCLVLAHAIDHNQQRIVQDAFQKKFPNVYTVKYHEMEINIYQRGEQTEIIH